MMMWILSKSFMWPLWTYAIATNVILFWEYWTFVRHCDLWPNGMSKKWSGSMTVSVSSEAERYLALYKEGPVKYLNK